MQHYSWFEVYRVALLELDSSKIPERLALARQKLKERMQMAGLTAEEQQAIVDALNNLHVVEVNEQSRGQTIGSVTAIGPLETFGSRCNPIGRGVL